MLVSKEFTFDAAHHLPNYHGKCERVHGHTWRACVTVDKPIDPETGMAIDFVILRRIIDECVRLKLDHADLNELFDNPSAENISIWIWDQLAKVLPLTEVKVWESDTSYVTHRG